MALKHNHKINRLPEAWHLNTTIKLTDRLKRGTKKHEIQGVLCT